MRRVVATVAFFLSSVVVLLLSNSEWFDRNEHVRPSSVSDSVNRGYVATLIYTGQQGSGIRGIVSQQCWIGSVVNEKYNLQVYMLEPLLHSTMFVGGINVIGGKSALPFGDLYDIEQFNRASVKMGLGQMVTIEDFFQSAPRKVTVLNIVKGVATTKVIWTAQNDSECYKKKRLLRSPIDKDLCIIKYIETMHPEENPQFRDTDYIFKDHSDHVLFEEWNPLESVLVVSDWRGSWYTPVDTVPTNTPVSEHPSDSSRCKYSDLENVREHLVPSPSLRKNVMMYKKMLLKGTSSPVKTVAVMFRLEQLISTTEAVCHRTVVPDSIEACIERCREEAVEITNSLRKQDGFSSHPFLTHDIGPYGSSTLQKKIASKKVPSFEFFEEGMNRTMQQLYGHAWTLADLEESYSEISENEGYIAALQRNIASDADCLVLLGGGNFQDLTLHDYIRKHPNVKGRCVHIVCARNEALLRSAMSSSD